jgi:hypothetical protein
MAAPNEPEWEEPLRAWLERCAPTRRKDYERAVVREAFGFMGIKRFADITPEKLKAYRADVIQKYKPSRAARRRLMAVCRFMNYCAKKVPLNMAVVDDCLKIYGAKETLDRINNRLDELEDKVSALHLPIKPIGGGVLFVIILLTMAVFISWLLTARVGNWEFLLSIGLVIIDALGFDRSRHFINEAVSAGKKLQLPWPELLRNQPSVRWLWGGVVCVITFAFANFWGFECTMAPLLKGHVTGPISASIRPFPEVRTEVAPPPKGTVIAQGTICALVYYDEDGSCDAKSYGWNDDEAPLLMQGAVISLTDDRGTLIGATAIKDQPYCFVGLAPGIYTVTEKNEPCYLLLRKEEPINTSETDHTRPIDKQEGPFDCGLPCVWVYEPEASREIATEECYQPGYRGYLRSVPVGLLAGSSIIVEFGHQLPPTPTPTFTPTPTPTPPPASPTPTFTPPLVPPTPTFTPPPAPPTPTFTPPPAPPTPTFTPPPAPPTPTFTPPPAPPTPTFTPPPAPPTPTPRATPITPRPPTPTPTLRLPTPTPPPPTPVSPVVGLFMADIMAFASVFGLNKAANGLNSGRS